MRATVRRLYLAKFFRAAALLLMAALLIPAIAGASPQPLDPGTVHVRILRRGVNRFIALQERDGVQLFGRIIAIDDQSFTLQLHNDPQTTEILYSDVAYLRTGFTAGQKVIVTAAIGGTVAFGIWGFVHIHNMENKPLTPPPTPALAILQ